MSEQHIDEEQLELGFDAGNYANSYESTDFECACKREGSDMNDPTYAAGFMLGFFSSYAPHEIPEDIRDEYLEIRHGELGRKAQEIGFVD